MVDNANPTGGATPLEKALEKSETVASDVQGAADDLAVVTTVLEQELPEEVQVSEVAQAIEHASKIEKLLVKSVERLTEANAALIQEIQVRKSEEPGASQIPTSPTSQGSQAAGRSPS